MNDSLQKALLAIVGAAISVAIGILLFFIKRKRDAKDSFLVFISTLRRSVDTSHVQEWYDKTKPAFRDAISSVYPFLRHKKKSSIDDTWSKYDSIPLDQLAQQNERDWVSEIDELDRVAPTQKPTRILADFFDRFEKAVK